MKKFINKKIGADDRFQQPEEFEGGGLTSGDLAKLDKETIRQSRRESRLMLSQSQMSDETRLEGLPMLSEFDDMFQDLTKKTFIGTDGLDVIEMIITYDSKYAITIVK